MGPQLRQSEGRSAPEDPVADRHRVTGHDGPLGGLSVAGQYSRAPDDRHRRAGGEEQRRDAEEGALGSSLGSHREISRPAVAPRHPRRRSALVVLVAAAPPDASLVAPVGGAVGPGTGVPDARGTARAIPSGADSRVSGRGAGTRGGAAGGSKARGSWRSSVCRSRSTNRCPAAAASATTFQRAASTRLAGHRCPRRLSTSATLATSPHGQLSCTASAISAQAGKRRRLACKKTRL